MAVLAEAVSAVAKNGVAECCNQADEASSGFDVAKHRGRQMKPDTRGLFEACLRGMSVADLVARGCRTGQLNAAAPFLCAPDDQPFDLRDYQRGRRMQRGVPRLLNCALSGSVGELEGGAPCSWC